MLRPRLPELLAVVAEAEKQIDDQLRASWFQASRAPEVFQARRKGASEAFRRLEGLLTEDDQ